MDADNQQERLDSSRIVGFTDEEGCFHVSINRIPEMSLGWQVLPEFRIVQHEKDEQLLHKGLENINKIIEFFNKNELKTSKRKDFEIFSKVIELMNNKEHLTKEGLDKIAKLISEMNRKPQLKYLESSETLRSTQK